MTGFRCPFAATAAAILLLGTAGVAEAAFIVGGITFEDNAFADRLVTSAGSPTFSGASSLEAAVIGADLDSYANLLDGDDKITLEFTDNVVVNGPGNDLAVFTLFDPRPITFYLEGDDFVVRATVTTVPTGTTITNGVPVNVGFYDLAFPLISSLRRISIASRDENDNLYPNQFAAVGALNTNPIPEPGSVILMTLGGLGLAGGVMRKRRNEPQAA